MAKTCEYNYGACERTATTTLKKNSGVVVQICEYHYELIIRLFKGSAAGEFKPEWKDRASHWLVKNKIPS